MTTPLLPQAFWFRLAMPCRKVENLPKDGPKRLLDLPDSCRLPETDRLDGKSPWADVRTAWNSAGFAVQIEVEGSLDQLADVDMALDRFGVQVWIDTRDTRDVSRATRFCHGFGAFLFPGKGKTSTPGLRVRQKPIPRAVAEAKICGSEKILARVDRLKEGWRIEIFFPAEVLQGFDPETNRRLGFCYLVNEPDREGQALGAGQPFPIGENPSLWSTLELID